VLDGGDLAISIGKALMRERTRVGGIALYALDLSLSQGPACCVIMLSHLLLGEQLLSKNSTMCAGCIAQGLPQSVPIEVTRGVMSISFPGTFSTLWMEWWNIFDN